MTRSVSAFLTLILLGGALSPIRAADDLAKQGYDLLKKYCYQCHGNEYSVPKLNVLDRDVMVNTKRGDEKRPKDPYLTPGKADKSFIWKRIDKKQMPPEEAAQPTEQERGLIKQWIEAGANFPTAGERRFVSEQDVITSIRDHLNKVLPEEDRVFCRYFTFTHLHNNKSVTDFDLRLYKAALSKAANSLSWERDIVIPQAIDKDKVVYYVDIRKLGWDKHDLWSGDYGKNRILEHYPYGLKYQGYVDDAFRAVISEMCQKSGATLPYIRADWFIATATRPPLYHIMLDLPKYDYDLEKKLNVDFQRNFMNNRLARAGFATSGVSKQNRMVERHPSAYGAYWKSYDFGPRNPKSYLTIFPLGPSFKSNPYDRHAFDHAGGELIFHLPNGLQGYLLVDKKGERIDEGPVEIVSDNLKTSGTPVIVNGLSCMACHRDGMIMNFKDAIREGHGLGDEARLKVEQLYYKQEDMDRLLKKDSNQFLQALDETVGPFLRVAEDKNKDLSAFPEVVGAIARLYTKDLTVTEAAYELGYDKPDELLLRLKIGDAADNLGLGPLRLKGGTINREHWEWLAPNSVYQNAARMFKIGTPYRGS